jgi:outer membrane protein OmpA-like peptidoglycan-associated protein
MKTKIIAVMIGSLLATSSYAGERNRTNKEESIGLGSGATIGALAGGPVGFIIGAAFGGWLGDRFHHERGERRAAVERAKDADSRAASASAHAASLETLLAATERAAAEKDAALYTERVAHREDLEEALSVEIFFRTEDSGVGSGTEERIARLASLVKPLDGAVIRLEGHTDARGTEKYNATLATARAEAVRDALVRAGMPAERIVVVAAGEADSTAPEQDAEGMALERRVKLDIVAPDEASRVALQSAE